MLQKRPKIIRNKLFILQKYENNLIKSTFVPQNIKNMLISELYTLYNQHPVITTDSRVCPYGSIFFALKGESFDGNAFAEKALQSGCSYAVIDDISYCADDRMILVDDVLTTLQQLACMHRKTLGIPVIGITGTNGKTTTKELAAAVLSKKYNTLYTQGNLNNHIGVPLTLLRLTGKHEIAVIEMGANHPGEIRDLANIARPDLGLITNVGYAHLEGFGSFEGVVRTKGELYEFVRIAGGKVFINKDNEYLTEIAGDLEQITYGMMPDFETPEKELFVSGKVLSRNPFLSFVWQQQGKGTQHYVETHLVGDYNLCNALAAITVGVYFDIAPEQINDAIANYEPSNNRSQLIKTKNNTITIDAYNANPSSMRAALENFASPPEKSLKTHFGDPRTKPSVTTVESLPKAVILGDMLELGEKSPELHTDIIKLTETLGIEKILLCGEQFSAVGKNHICFSSVVALDEFLKEEPLCGYHILIKGSHGIHLEKIIDKL